MVDCARTTSRLVLGTVQLGVPYGIANRTGQPSPTQAQEIVAKAYEGGIRWFDTAQDYGESEVCLGTCLKHLGIQDEVHIVSKLSLDLNHLDYTSLRTAVLQSLERLQVEKLSGLLLHAEELLDLLDQGLAENLTRLIEEKLVAKTGTSLYTVERAHSALAQSAISILQVPANPFDTRMLRSGVFAQAAARHASIFVRSVFLQGLLLLPEHCIPTHMHFALHALSRYHAAANRRGLSAQQLALAYAKSALDGAMIVVGAETAQQVSENCALWNQIECDPSLATFGEQFLDIDERIADPRRWGETA